MVRQHPMKTRNLEMTTPDELCCDIQFDFHSVARQLGRCCDEFVRLSLHPLPEMCRDRLRREAPANKTVTDASLQVKAEGGMGVCVGMLLWTDARPIQPIAISVVASFTEARRDTVDHLVVRGCDCVDRLTF